MSIEKIDDVMEDRPLYLAPPASNPSPEKVESFGRLNGLVLTTIALVLCFSRPLYHLVRFAVTAEFHSYIVLVPFVSLYLVWLKRDVLVRHSEPARIWALPPLIAGMAALACYWLANGAAVQPIQEDDLALSTLAFVLFLLSACCLFLGRESLKAITFPLWFLLFMVPLPTFLRESIETFLQHGSAAAAYVLFKWSGTSVFWKEVYLQLPGFSLQVARECSGIHSTVALFLASLLAAHFFLQKPWKQVVLVVAVIPLGILRNALRIFVVGQLCVHIGPEMINSNIHRRGGPLFFALSLVPFFLLLIVLRKSQRAKERSQSKSIEV